MRQRNGGKAIHLENKDVVSGEQEHKILSPPQQPNHPFPPFLFLLTLLPPCWSSSEYKGKRVHKAVDTGRRKKGTKRPKIPPYECSEGRSNINRTMLDTIYTHLAPLRYSLTSCWCQNLYSRRCLGNMTTSNPHGFRNVLKIYTHSLDIKIINIFFTSIQMHFQSKLLLVLSKRVVTKHLYVLFHPCMPKSHPHVHFNFNQFWLALFTPPPLLSLSLLY
jgi:hypothetical protein